jgi:hypothetical protein
VDKAEEDRSRFNYWMTEFYVLKHKPYIEKCINPISQDEQIATDICSKAIGVLAYCENPAEHIKTWNRKQEIIDIIQEALTCTPK